MQIHQPTKITMDTIIKGHLWVYKSGDIQSFTKGTPHLATWRQRQAIRIRSALEANLSNVTMEQLDRAWQDLMVSQGIIHPSRTNTTTPVQFFNMETDQWELIQHKH